MTDIGTTPRARLSPRTRLAVWEAHKGVCCLCGGKIDGVREPWIVEHVRPLPGSKASGLKRHMDGTVSRRET